MVLNSTQQYLIVKSLRTLNRKGIIRYMLFNIMFLFMPRTIIKNINLSSHGMNYNKEHK